MGELPRVKMFPETFSRKLPYKCKGKVLRVVDEGNFDDPFSRDVLRVISPDPKIKIVLMIQIMK